MTRDEVLTLFVVCLGLSVCLSVSVTYMHADGQCL